MNNVSLLGRLTKDANITYSGELAIARFTIAVDRRIKRENEATADFISCVAFGKSAEIIEKYFGKGSRIALTGRIQTGSYKNKDGATVYTTDVIADNVEFVDSKADNEARQENARRDNGNTNPQDADGFKAVADSVDEDLPFI